LLGYKCISMIRCQQIEIWIQWR